ncbi:Uncharacterized protein FWK35_00001991, partial [Aphis craccivora]
ILNGAMNVLILQCCVFFFVSVYTRTCRNNARISKFGGFRFCIGRSFFEFPNSLQKRREKPKKKRRKNGNFYAKPDLTKTIFLNGCNSKTNHCKYIKISPNSQFYFISVYSSNFYEICRKREKLQRNDNDLSSNDFKYFISRKYLKILPFLIISHKVENIIQAYNNYKIT